LLSAALLAVVSSRPAQAASEPAALPVDDQPVEALTELDEVKVRGRLVANAVTRTENLVFRRYNILNSDNRYDVHCGDVRRSRDSLAMLRMCLPEFLGDVMPPRLVSASFGSRAHFGTTPACGWMNSGVDANGNMFSFSGCSGGFGTSSFLYTPPYYGSSYVRPAALVPPAPISAERRAEFVQNMSRVLNSDPELKAMATELAGMYREVDRVQAQYAKLLGERRAAQSAKMAAARERARARGRSLRPPPPRAL
jgi:hypothetical protein